MLLNNQKNAHHCEALVVHCIDFRFHEAIRDFLKNELVIKSYDLLTIPGAAKHLTAAGSASRREGLLEDMGVSLRLHAPKEIILINHADCGAYGGASAFASVEEERKNHESALKEAAEVLQQNFSGITVKLYYADLADKNITLSPIQ